MAAAAAASEPTITWRLFPATSASGKAPPRGKTEFDAACGICHGSGGPDRPGTGSLRLKYGATKPALLEERTDLTAEVVTYFIRHGIAMMPQFRKTELNDQQAAAIAAYLSRKRR